jgi:rubrerythrin
MSAQETVEVDPVDVVERDADSKGRVTVGADYAGETVRVAVLAVPSRESDSETEDDAERVEAWLCGSCQQTILSSGEPAECPSCGSSERLDRLDAAHVEDGGQA